MAEGTAVNALGDFSPGYDPTENLGGHMDCGGGDFSVNLVTGHIMQKGVIIGFIDLNAILSRMGTLSLDLNRGYINHITDGTSSMVGKVSTGSRTSAYSAIVEIEPNVAMDPANVDPETGAHPCGWAFEKLVGPHWCWFSGEWYGAEGSAAG